MKVNDSMISGNRILSDELECKRYPYYLILPITYLLTLWTIIKKKIGALFGVQENVGLLIFDGIGRYGNIIKRHVTGWKAVDLIYNHQFRKTRSLGGWLDDFWFESMNCQAARNRFKIAKRQLENSILSFSNQNEIRVVSLACGTGQIESEAMASIKEKGKNVKALLIDREERALKRAEKYISFNGVQNEVELVHSDITSDIEMFQKFNPHVVNMIAFLDYLSDEDSIKFISSIYEILPPKGVLIVSNTMPNAEMPFVKWVVGWQLIYRKARDIEDIMQKSGFVQCEVIEDPLHIQGLVTARKT